jgi:hypothetical protein
MKDKKVEPNISKQNTSKRRRSPSPVRRENNYSRRDQRDQQDRRSTRDDQIRTKGRDESWQTSTTITKGKRRKMSSNMTPTNLPTGDETETRMIGDSKVKAC